MKRLLNVICLSINSAGVLIGFVAHSAFLFFWALCFWAWSAFALLKEEQNAVH